MGCDRRKRGLPFGQNDPSQATLVNESSRVARAAGVTVEHVDLGAPEFGGQNRFPPGKLLKSSCSLLQLGVQIPYLFHETQTPLRTHLLPPNSGAQVDLLHYVGKTGGSLHAAVNWLAPICRANASVRIRFSRPAKASSPVHLRT